QATYGTEPLQSVDSERSDLNNNMSPPPPPLIRSTYQSPAPQYSERSGCLNAIVLFLKVVFFGIAGIIAASLMITLFGLIFASAQFLPIESLFVNPGLEHNLLWTSIILSLGVPIVGVIVWIVRRVMNAKSRPFIGFTVAVLWFIGIVVGLTLGYKITKKFSIESLQETDIVLTSPSNNKMYVEMSKYPLDYFSVAPLASKINIDIAGYNDYDLEVLPFFNVEEDSLLFNSIQLRIKTSNDSLFHVKTMSYSFDKSYKMAKANIKEFDFKIEQNDSVLSIPQFFKTPKSQGYRNQFIVIDIFVPSGSKLEVNDDLAEYKRSRTLRVFRRRSVREYNRNNIYDWNSDEDNMLENGEVTETSETRLMNQLDIKL
ncbi:MAG: hypothetical protein PHN55_12655, partial [Dysgonamonadaceae bacterium]|nr:hypothetical protein [Dysgonamonadaceae bacterium]